MRLPPQQEALKFALAEFRSGDISSCLSALATNQSPEACALRIRALVRSNRAAAALDVLSHIQFDELSHRDAAELLILQVSASIAAGNDIVAESAMLEAKARSYGVGSPELEAELRFYCAMFAWTKGRFEEASVELSTFVKARSDVPEWLIDRSGSYSFTFNFWIARAYELLGMTAALEGNFEKQASYLIRAFEQYDAADCVDTGVEASMLSNLAVLVRDLQNPELAAFVRERLGRITWIPAIDEHRFLALRAMGWCSTLKGDHLGGLREFRHSAEIAPKKTFRIVALLDRAFIANELNEKFFAMEELDLACRYADQVDWESTLRTDRAVLLDLASSLAPFDAPASRKFLDRYTSLKTSLSPLEMYSKDRRRRGEECLATAAVVRAEYQLDRATMLYKEAFAIWSEIGYSWRAAATALEIYTLTGDVGYLDVVAREAVARPLSWIARRYATVVLDDPAIYTRL
jgi:tetratricopeptide (TPR) repeat protein